MRRFVTFGPALVVLLSAALALVAGPAALRQMRFAQVQANVQLAQQRLDSDDLLERIDRAVADIAQSVEPSVVHIEARTSDGGLSSGAGWIYDELGHVVTNGHVVRGATEVEVQFFDGHEEPASAILEIDPLTDIAVLKVDTLAGLIPARRASGRHVRTGERVYAFGSPFGFKFSMTDGVVSGVGRNALGVTGRSGYTNFIQTDAAVNPGNSGGPLVHVGGRVVGMNTAIVTSDSPIAQTTSKSQSAGVGFAIPLETIESVVEQIISRGFVLRGYLGIQLTDGVSREPTLFRGGAIIVREVIAGSPAEAAGLMIGDLITHLDGDRISDSAVFRARVSARRPGERIVATVWRNEQVLEVPIVLGAGQFDRRNELVQVDPRQADDVDATTRVVLTALARFGLLEMAPLDDEDGGLLVRMIRNGSVASEVGLLEGHVITSVDGAPVRAIVDLVDRFATGMGEPVRLTVREPGGGTRDLIVNLGR